MRAIHYQLDRAKEHLQASMEAQETADLARARHHLLQSARYMLEAAQDTDNSRVQAQRMDYARQFQERADALVSRIEAQKRARDSALRPVPASSDEPDASAWLVVERPDVNFDDVAGLEDVKQQIRMKLIYAFTHPSAARRFGIGSGGGILLYGPPGTGKTLLAKAVAGELDAAFFAMKPSQLTSKWFGKTEKNVAALFEAARQWDRVVIFLDEVEALVPKRRSTGSSVMPRVVDQFLQELDGVGGKHPGLLLLGATNEPWLLDPAMMRPGRFDERIYVPLPGHAPRLRILELNLKDRPLAPGIDLTVLAERLAGYSGADIAHICHRACEFPFLEAVTMGLERDVTLGDFESALREVKPSVAQKELRKFEAFAEER